MDECVILTSYVLRIAVIPPRTLFNGGKASAAWPTATAMFLVAFQAVLPAVPPDV